jgi:hypothetical protein
MKARGKRKPDALGLGVPKQTAAPRVCVLGPLQVLMIRPVFERTPSLFLNSLPSG